MSPGNLHTQLDVPLAFIERKPFNHLRFKMQIPEGGGSALH